MRHWDMPGGSQPATVVVGLPAEIDYSNSHQVRQLLTAAVRPGVTVVIADMTSTVFCDSAGVAALAAARSQADQHGTELRVVMRSRLLGTVFQTTGLDTVLSLYPSVGATLNGAG